jgi:DNA-binding SARP family transcriptional activator/tetratricopeptide (TPR) repeat protein
MWIGLLGSLLVRVDGAAVAVPAARQRALLAVLAVRAGELVSTDELAETVWDGMPPDRAVATIRNYVKRLRFRLGSAGGQIVSCRPGYRLEVAEDELDLLVFTRLCRDGGVAMRAGDGAAAFGGLGQALGLWRGTPFADSGCERLRREQVPPLCELRLQAAEWRAEAGLALGRQAELVGELAGWCAAEPLRERFALLRMLALYRSGRQGDALAVYQQVRRMLVDDLGVEPGEDLRRLHQQILARDPALAAPEERDAVPVERSAAPPPAAPASGPDARVVPRQLPAAVARFAGRSGELGVLTGLAEQAASGAGGTVVISAIGGTAGVGKTTLAVHFAHQVAGLFPDGQLYADLRGFSPAREQVPSGQAMRGFLDALGVAPQAVPADADAQAGLYRSVLAGKRMLVVIDNVRDAAQVRPLLPGSAGCLVVVTSRSQLTGLAATGDARLLTIGLLTEAEARELLAGRLGTRRVEAEPEATDELIRLCARLPLALAITAARATACPAHPLAALAAELRTVGGPLDALDTGEPAVSVRAVFSWSYEQLSPAAARLFRLLGIHPGPDISAPAAASLAGVEPAQARRLLAELARAHLITELVPSRYGFHDLLRAYAAEQACTLDSGTDRSTATRRLLDHYLHTAYAAAVLFNPVRKSFSIAPPEPGVTSEHLAVYQALAWFEAEHHVLLAAATLAAETGFDRHAWQLPWTMGDYLDSRGYWHELAAIQRSAVDAATRLGDTGGQAASHRALAGAYTQLARYDLAHAHLANSLELYRRLGDRAGQARVHLSLAWVSDFQERYADALGHCEQALGLFQATGDQIWQARALSSIGWFCAHLGRHQQARAFCLRSVALLRELGHRPYEAESWQSLGYAEHQSGDHVAAAACYQRALDLFREFGDRYSQATVLIHLGDAQHAAGQTQAARRAWQEALVILSALHHPDAGKVRAKLRQDGLEETTTRPPGTAAESQQAPGPSAAPGAVGAS